MPMSERQDPAIEWSGRNAIFVDSRR